MRGLVSMLTIAWVAWANPALADDEASNVAHVVAGPYGRCYAKSVPSHVYDPEGEPRQQGQTDIYHVRKAADLLVRRYRWFSQTLFVNCLPGGEPVVVRVGPWPRGHNPSADHLAIAFYQAGQPIRRYSTLDIVGDDKSEEGDLSDHKKVSASESHYTVFASGPAMTKITKSVGSIFKEDWVIEATAIDGRVLVFDMATGELR